MAHSERYGNTVIHYLEATTEEKKFVNKARGAVHDALLPLAKEYSGEVNQDLRITATQCCLACALFMTDILAANLNSNGLDKDVAEEIALELGDKVILALNEAMRRAQTTLQSNN